MTDPGVLEHVCMKPRSPARGAAPAAQAAGLLLEGARVCGLARPRSACSAPETPARRSRGALRDRAAPACRRGASAARAAAGGAPAAFDERWHGEWKARRHRARPAPPAPERWSSRPPGPARRRGAPALRTF